MIIKSEDFVYIGIHLASNGRGSGIISYTLKWFSQTDILRTVEIIRVKYKRKVTIIFVLLVMMHNSLLRSHSPSFWSSAFTKFPVTCMSYSDV